MRVLFDHLVPFRLTHGGFQTQIEQTARGLRDAGVDVEFLRWWDDSQPADLIHFFGVAPVSYLHLARSKNIPVVMTNLFTETCNRSDAHLRRQGLATQLLLKLPFGGGIKCQLTWPSFSESPRLVVGLEAERKVLEIVYRVPRERIAIVPLGLSEAFLSAGTGSRKHKHLIYTGTITDRKRCVELAEVARCAQVPVLFVGKPYSLADPYWKRFSALIDNSIVRYQPHVSDENAMIAELKEARGFVLMSRFENWCLSAHEAAACGLPLLLPDQKWSRECFGEQARYFGSDLREQVQQLRDFYEWCGTAPSPQIRLFSWRDVAEKLRSVYAEVLSNSR